MALTASQKDRKRAFPDVPEREGAVAPIVDNHMHVYPDPEPETTGGEVVQNLNDAGAWKPPLLLKNLLDGMRRAGMRAAISSGCEYPLLEFTRDLAADNERLWASLAIHPNEAAMHAGVREVAPDGLAPQVEPHHSISLDDALAKVAELAADPHVVAVGETGLDYFRTGPAGKEAQKEAFRAHIALAKELGKPMQIHDRDAHADVVEVLLAEGAPERTVFHCFSGDRELAEILAENGWYASFAGNVTYPANEAIREGLDVMPRELIMFETDSPYLTPVPFRGQPNAPWGAVYTGRFIAQRLGVDADELFEQVNDNTHQVYGI